MYDETIHTLQDAVARAKIGAKDKDQAIGKLHELARRAEENFTLADRPDFDGLLEKERRESLERYGGRTVSPKRKPPRDEGQLSLF
ncbi:MAG: hypothetical protein AAFN92_19360 [Bacteroidota bacterium]